MALIAEGHPAASQSSQDFWRNELTNSRILLHELDKAICALMKNEVKSYTLDTGQNSQTVTRQDLPLLIERRKSLLDQIESIEGLTGEDSARGAQCIQVVPAW